jgi:hypothetical protein
MILITHPTRRASAKCRPSSFSRSGRERFA